MGPRMSTPICSFIPEVFSCIISFAFGCICILNTEIISYGHTYQSSQYLIKTRTATYPKATVPFNERPPVHRFDVCDL